jgi:hypothetical protein
MHLLTEIAALAPIGIVTVMFLQFAVERAFTARDLHRARKQKLARRQAREERLAAQLPVQSRYTHTRTRATKCIHTPSR